MANLLLDRVYIWNPTVSCQSETRGWKTPFGAYISGVFRLHYSWRFVAKSLENAFFVKRTVLRIRQSLRTGRDEGAGERVTRLGTSPTVPLVTSQRRCGELRGRRPEKTGGVFAGLHWDFLSGPERRRWSSIIRRSGTINVGQVL